MNDMPHRRQLDEALAAARYDRALEIGLRALAAATPNALERLQACAGALEDRERQWQPAALAAELEGLAATLAGLEVHLDDLARVLEKAGGPQAPRLGRLDAERIARAAEQARGLPAGGQLGPHRPALLRATYSAAGHLQRLFEEPAEGADDISAYAERVHQALVGLRLGRRVTAACLALFTASG